MRNKTKKSRYLTIYLIKDEFVSPKEIVEDIDSLDKQEIKPIGTLYIRPSKSHPPAWVTLFEGVINFSKLSVLTSSTAAVLLVKAEKRIFALTFGVGRHLLKSGSWEERFGLKVTLNSIDPNRIRSIDKTTFDVISRHSRIQSGQEGTVYDFGIDIEQDLLRAATGVPLDSNLGIHLTGRDALSVVVKADLTDIPSLLKSYYNKFLEDSYKNSPFSFIDHIQEVGNKQLQETLDGLLIKTIKENDFRRIWLSIPYIVDWADFGGFRYTDSIQAEAYDDITLPSFLASLKNQENISVEILKQRKVYFFSGGGSLSISKWPVYECIYCEIDFDGNTYILNGSKWFEIETDFVTRVNKEISSFPIVDNILPPYNERTEDEYNEKVHKSDQQMYSLMHKKMIPRGGPHDRIEFCDLFTKSNRIIHVKRYGKSDVFSHFFSQAVVSAELFHLDLIFRQEVNKRLPSSHKILNITNIHSAEYEVVLAVISDSAERFPTLPFFSRINLRNAINRILGDGYKKVLLTKISASPGSLKKKRKTAHK